MRLTNLVLGGGGSGGEQPTPTPADKDSAMQRSSSMQNITYIDYDVNTPPTAIVSQSPLARESSAVQSTPPAQPTTPGASPAKDPAEASKSGRYIDFQAKLNEQEKEKEKLEQKKLASLRDVHALVVREKDAEIAKLKEEVASMTALYEQVSILHK